MSWLKGGVWGRNSPNQRVNHKQRSIPGVSLLLASVFGISPKVEAFKNWITRSKNTILMIMKKWFFLITILIGLAFPALAQVQVRDADTIVVNGTPIRMNGVDAPELGTAAGRDARRWMIKYLRGKEISCQLNGEVSHDRKIGVCFAEGEDIGAAVISAGYALDCARYSGGRYRKLETSAAKSRLMRAQYC